MMYGRSYSLVVIDETAPAYTRTSNCPHRCTCCSAWCDGGTIPSGNWIIAIDWVRPEPELPRFALKAESSGSLKSWLIWMGWARALPRYRRRARQFVPFLPVKTRLKPGYYGRGRGHGFGHSPRLRPIGG